MKKIVLTLLMIPLLFGCQPVKTKDIISGQFAHTVLIWMKNPDSSAEKSQLESGLKQLVEKSDYVRSAHLGIPALTDRPVVDNSYSFCLIVTFDSKEAQDKYQVEPAHLQFLENHKDLWNRILIYDSMNQLEDTENLR